MHGQEEKRNILVGVAIVVGVVVLVKLLKKKPKTQKA
jgi:hypothetical protein